MSQKKCTCPHCSKENVYTEPSWDEALAEKLPVNLAKAFGITILTVLTGGLAGLIAGGVLYGSNVIRYLDGVSMTCGGCGRDFKVN
jgi:hypothetical protein